MMKSIARYCVASLFLLCLNQASPAQTVRGDILRGEGRYLEGAGWYNLNTARANRINVESWKAVNREAQRLYRDYMADRAKRISRSKGLTEKHEDTLYKKMAEDQRRWRDNPSPDDIASGDALNAIASDLADPEISPSVWRTATVPLPKGTTLTAMAFKIADPKKSKLQQSTVAIDRMRIAEKSWPLPFRRPAMRKPCEKYEAAVENVVGKCLKGTELQSDDFDRLRAAVEALKQAVQDEIPFADDQQKQAFAYALRLDEATRIFAEQTYAEQLIRDVSDHEATTVAELLAFMRDYRLLFAASDSSPEVAHLYNDLYGLLRRQKEILGIGIGPRPSDIFAAGTVWANGNENRPVKLRVTQRNGDEFHAMFILGKDTPLVRSIQGRVGDDTVTWSNADGETIRGGPQRKAQRKAQEKTKGMRGGDVTIVGTFQGEELHFTPNLPNGPAEIVLRKMR